MPSRDALPDLSEKIRAYREAYGRRLAEAFAAERERRREAGQFFYEGFWLSEPQLARLKKALTTRRLMALADFHLLLAILAAIVFGIWRIFIVFFFP